MKFDESNGDILVYVQVQSGTLLSSFGHNLKIRVGTFTVEADLEAEHIETHVDASSLKPVDSIDWKSRQETGDLSDGNRRDIKQNIDQDVLHAEKYPKITFESSSIEGTGGEWKLTGDLTLCGEQKTITFDVEKSDHRVRGEVVIDQTEFGIEPYSALLGSLKVAPEVIVEVDAPLPDQD